MTPKPEPARLRTAQAGRPTVKPSRFVEVLETVGVAIAVAGALLDPDVLGASGVVLIALAQAGRAALIWRAVGSPWARAVSIALIPCMLALAATYADRSTFAWLLLAVAILLILLREMLVRRALAVTEPGGSSQPVSD